MRPDWVDQAHRDPSLGRLRPRSIDRMRIAPERRQAYDTLSHQLDLVETQLVEPGPVELAPRSRDWVRTIDRILVIAIVFVGAVWFVSRLIADATCGV